VRVPKLAAYALVLFVFTSVSVPGRQVPVINPAGSTYTVAVQNALPSTNDEGSDVDSQSAAVFQTTVRNLFNEGKFAQLEEIADAARSQKSRFPGGAWKLHSFYGVVQGPGSLTATDAVWNAHMQRLQSWIDFKPDSSTPRVALAESQLRFAWKARGNGLGNTVTADAWKLFRERVQKAEEILEQAKSVSSNDPQWYQAMQTVALAQGWDQKRAEQLLVEANGVEPGYYYFYNSHASYLLPKWYGKPGDSEAFAQSIADRVGGPEGDSIYFQLALSLNCCKAKAQAPAISWDRVKQGFASMEQLYGATNFDRNALAFMAVRQGDREFAQQLFARIGDNWNQRVWGSKDKFDSSKTSLSQAD
jgi:Domain of unknown function (DUF4034)